MSKGKKADSWCSHNTTVCLDFDIVAFQRQLNAEAIASLVADRTHFDPGRGVVCQLLAYRSQRGPKWKTFGRDTLGYVVVLSILVIETELSDFLQRLHCDEIK